MALCIWELYFTGHSSALHFTLSESEMKILFLSSQVTPISFFPSHLHMSILLYCNQPFLFQRADFVQLLGAGNILVKN